MPEKAPVPQEERSPSLRAYLRGYMDLVARVSAANPELAREHQNLFYFFVYAWLADPGGDPEVEADLARRMEEYARLGFDGDRVRSELSQVMDEDKHLKECCSTPTSLAYFLDIEFIGHAAPHQNDASISDEEYGKMFEALFASVLQYFKDGIVHVDYTVPHFFPPWVNGIRKRGIFYVGEPHRLWYAGGQRFYRLSRAEAKQVGRWWSLSLTPAVAGRLNEERNKLRQAMRRAGIFYESHHEKLDATSKLIDLAIALEALFSPSDKGELTYRMAQSASFLIAEDVEERKEVYRFVKKMYSRRSALFHGQYDADAYSDGKFVTDDEIERLASIIRRSMLRFLVLFLRGSNSQ